MRTELARDNVDGEVPTPAQNGEAMQRIGEESLEAAGLVFGLLDHSARQRETLEQQLYEGMEADRDRWKKRALDAERRLGRAAERLVDLLFPDDYPEVG